MRLRKALEQLRSRVPASLRWEPWSVLVPLIVLQWLVVVHVARHATHNGWLYHHDRSAAVIYAAARSIGHGSLPAAESGHGLPILLAPITWFAGPSFPEALHVLIPLQILVLLPLGALGAFALGARAGGRLVGYVSAAIWAVGPLASLTLFNGPRWLDQTLPTILGLTELVYLPSMLAVLAAAVLVLRALDERRLVDAAAAGVVAGFAIALEPTNAFFLGAPILAFAAGRRWRDLALFLAALAPCLLTYLLWRERGIGHVGSLSEALLLPKTIFTWSYNLQIKFLQMQTSTWSPRLLEWVALAGFVGLLRRSPLKAVFFGAWFGGYVALAGSSRENVADGIAFWHWWLPAFPAFSVLAASLPFLWPRFAKRHASRWPYRPRHVVPTAAVAALAALAVVVPFAVVAFEPPDRRMDTSIVLPSGSVVPIVHSLRVEARVENGRVRLAWQPAKLPAKVSYAVYAGRDSDVRCTTKSGATRCALTSPLLARTRRTTISTGQQKGLFSYRVGVVVNEQSNAAAGSAVAISPPVHVSP
jgi:hypothetical protein